MKIYTILFMMCILHIIACSDDNPASSMSADLVEVQFDLHSGFYDVAVSIRENDTYYFEAFFTGIEPLAGPQASFTTYLATGEHCLIMRRRPFNFYSPSKYDTTKITVGDAEKYWIGIHAYPDSLHVVVQDSAFMYI
jgi:hypothetical protein